MNRAVALLGVCFFNLSLLFCHQAEIPTSHPTEKVVIVGAGIIGAMEAYHAHLDAVKKGTKKQVFVYDKGPSFDELKRAGVSLDSTNASFNIFPSLTPDEIVSVVPRGSELIEKLALLFSEPGGIRVDDVPGSNDSPAAVKFKEAVELYGKDKNHDDRTKHLLQLGKLSMDLWQNFYEHADEELKDILRESNFNPCHDPKNKDTMALHDGYRIDLIYEVSGAHSKAKGMLSTYEKLGYTQCKLLSPNQVMTIDPFLKDFCLAHSEPDENQELKWKDDSAAIWRPGGCISSRIFIPKFYAYLKKIMGTFVDQDGEVKDCFTMKFNKEVIAVELDKALHIVGLKFSDGSWEHDNHHHARTSYVFCQGEAVGTLSRLGFDEPTYAGFAGPSLFLDIPLTPEQSEQYRNFSHCMEVHKVGIVLAWQARFKDDRLIIAVAGTKAFYGDQQPAIDQDFARNRHLVQLNMINAVLPEMVSIACGRSTQGSQLLPSDINTLESMGILRRWVGRRAVAYDGFPTLGALYHRGEKVKNARATTHLGSGGVSFAIGAVQMSRSCENAEDEFTAKILQYADSRRRPEDLGPQNMWE